MAQLTVNVPDALVPRVIAALRAYYPDLDPGLTTAQVGREAIRRHLRLVVAMAEGQAAADAIEADVRAAHDAAVAAADAATAAIT